jgi:hypothetical protein
MNDRDSAEAEALRLSQTKAQRGRGGGVVEDAQPRDNRARIREINVLRHSTTGRSGDTVGALRRTYESAFFPIGRSF